MKAYGAELSQIRDLNGGNLPEELQRLVDTVHTDVDRFDPLWIVETFPDDDPIQVRAPDLATAKKIWEYLRPHTLTPIDPKQSSTNSGCSTALN